MTALEWKVWEQAWAHFRHLEIMRSQYLGFFFTIGLAVSALAIKQIADDALGSGATLAVFATLAVLLDLLAAFFVLAVARIGVMLNYYYAIIFAVGDRVSDSADLGVFGFWAHPPPVSSRLVSTHRGAEWAMRVPVALVPCALLAATVRAATSAGVGLPTVLGCALATAVAIMSSVACLHALEAARA